MSSLKDRIEWLERELPPNPCRFKIHDGLPFAILRYDPQEEWTLRREVRHLGTRLGNAGLEVTTISLADLMWQAIDESEGMETLIELERERGFEEAEKQVNVYMSDRDFSPLPQMLEKILCSLDPTRSVAFLVRAASLAPSIYHVSMLLEQMKGRTQVPTILFYPGHMRGGNSLQFMDLPERDTPASYRVKIYG